MPSMNARVTHCFGLPLRKYSSLARNDTRPRRHQRDQEAVHERQVVGGEDDRPGPGHVRRRRAPRAGRRRRRQRQQDRPEQRRRAARQPSRCASTAAISSGSGVVDAGHHLQRSPVPELGDAVQGRPRGPRRTGGFRHGRPFQQLDEYAEQRRALLAEPDVVARAADRAGTSARTCRARPGRTRRTAGRARAAPSRGSASRPPIVSATRSAELAVALPGDRREQRLMGGEVAARGAVRHPGPARDLPQRQRVGARLGRAARRRPRSAVSRCPALHRQCLPAARRHCLPGQSTGGAQAGRGIRQKGGRPGRRRRGRRPEAGWRRGPGTGRARRFGGSSTITSKWICWGTAGSGQVGAAVVGGESGRRGRSVVVCAVTRRSRRSA